MIFTSLFRKQKLVAKIPLEQSKTWCIVVAKTVYRESSTYVGVPFMCDSISL